MLIHGESEKSRLPTFSLNIKYLFITDELTFDTETVGRVISNLSRGKAPDIDGLTCEHLVFCHWCLPVTLLKLFNIISSILYTPQSFKYSYIVPIPKVKDHRSKSMQYDAIQSVLYYVKSMSIVY